MPKISALNNIEQLTTSSILPVVDGNETQKVTLQRVIEFVSASIDVTFATEIELLQSASSITSSLNAFASASVLSVASKLSTSSFEAYTASVSSVNTSSLLLSSSFNTFTSSYKTDSSSFDSRITAATNEQDLSGLVTTSSFNSYTASNDSRVNSLINATSSYITSAQTSSFITESETGSFVTDVSMFLSKSIFDSYTSSLSGAISSSAQITSLGFATTSSVLSVDTSSLVTTSSFNSYTASISTASLVSRLNSIESVSGSWITESETGSFALTSNLPNVTPFLSASTFNTFTSSVNTSLSNVYTATASLNTFTSSYVTDSGSFDSRITALVTSGVPAGTISGSTQIINLGFATTSSIVDLTSLNSFTSSINTTIKSKLNADNVLSGSISYTSLTNVPSGIVSSSTQLTNLGFAITGSNTFIGNQAINGDLVVTGSITAQTYVISSSQIYVTQSWSSGSTIFGNDITDTHQFTGSVSVSGSFTASLLEGYMWAGDSSNRANAVTTSSLLSTASFNSWTGSTFNTLSSSVSNVQNNLNQVTASLGATSNAFSFTNVVNPANLVLVSYLTSSFNGGVIDILGVNNSNGTATSTNYQFASYGSNTGISQNGKQTSGAGAPNLAPTMIVSGSYINIVVTLSGTYNIKGVARLF